MTCSVADCAKIATKRGWCEAHYRLWLRNGDPLVKRKRANGEGYLQGGYAGHQRTGVRKFDHIIVAERALGRPLPAGAVVHHINEDRRDNRNENLVICPSRAYHNLLHARMRALAACGHADRRPCRRCHRYDELSNLRCYPRTNTTSFWHVLCERAATKERRQQT